ncbi:glycosyltransferase [Diplocloster hominis]|uniref:glycosyltransferase n=1 Tax=Diplocloster hominis TaxID=3079010 RepID=UPI0031B9DFC8
MKKIAMFTMGTRGDVQPYIYLARALNKYGYETLIGSHPCWKELIEHGGITFKPIGPDINIEKTAAIIRGKNSNPIVSMLKTMNFVFKIIRNSTNEIYEACKGNDLIIVSHSQMGATEAEALGIPTVNVTLQTEMIAEKLKKQKWAGKLVGNLISVQMAKPYNKIRKVYGLPKVKSSDEIMSKKLNMIPISKYVTERNPYWESHHILTGYWYEDEKNYIPERKMADFLANGDKPIILALGAMAFEDKEEREKLGMFIRAFRACGKRAVIQGFQKSLQNYKLPDTMIACGSVPHSWLFKQGYCVIHHCGFGTASASLIYGIPSIPVPHVLDQMGFAMRLSELDVSVKPIRSKDLSEERIIGAINEMQQVYDEKRKKAEEISKKIQAEGGVDKAVELITHAIMSQECS